MSQIAFIELCRLIVLLGVGWYLC